jgi:hypothetical protein
LKDHGNVIKMVIVFWACGSVPSDIWRREREKKGEKKERKSEVGGRVGVVSEGGSGAE